MSNEQEPSLSRRDLLRIGSAGIIATVGANTASAQQRGQGRGSGRQRQQQRSRVRQREHRESGMTHAVITPDNPCLVREREKCTRCGHCLDYCYRYNTVQGHRSAEGRFSCIHCGQCSIQCKNHSITERSEIETFKTVLADPDKIVVVTTAPAVRASIGEMFAMPNGSDVEGKIVAALRRLGCKYVFDTTFAADLTTMEEASELLERLATKSDEKYPLFTSCCPAWVRFAELFTPQLIPHISTAKSPIMMQGATVKTYFAEKHKFDPRKIFNVALTPCTAKKGEIKRPGSNTLTRQPNSEGLAEVDLVLTAREFGNLLLERNINFANLPSTKYDSLMGRGSGSGVSFGMTGGVMESALRTAYYLKHKKNAPLQKEAEIRGEKLTVNWCNPMPFAGRIAGIREDKIDFGERQLRIAVVETPSSLRGLLDAIENEGERFDFVEVMACRGGCLGGGGQPYPDVDDDVMELVYDRRDALQTGVERSVVRLCHENVEVQSAYREYFGAPLSGKAKALLHCG